MKLVWASVCTETTQKHCKPTAISEETELLPLLEVTSGGKKKHRDER